MKKFTLSLLFAIPLFCMAQQSLSREYHYDAAGNRTLRKVLEIGLPDFAPPSQDSLPPLTSAPPLTPLTSLESTAEAPPYFLETLAQTQIKIYPNPTTEKITLEITNWETLQTGVFKLYSLSGQLLQEQPVQSLNTTISLAGVPKGTYLLNVTINDATEVWKVIKN